MAVAIHALHRRIIAVLGFLSAAPELNQNRRANGRTGSDHAAAVRSTQPDALLRAACGEGPATPASLTSPSEGRTRSWRLPALRPSWHERPPARTGTRAPSCSHLRT